MIDSRELYRELLKETVAYLSQFDQGKFFPCTDPTLFAAKNQPAKKEEIPSRPLIKKQSVSFSPPPKKENVKILETAPVKKEELPVSSESILSAPITPSVQIQETLKKVAPSLSILRAIPSDEEACTVKNRWKLKSAAAILILTNEKKQEPISFWHNLAKAIEGHFALAELVQIESIEKIDFLEGCKLILAVEKDILQSKKMYSFYKKLPSTHEVFLGALPVIILQHSSYYTDNPNNKRLLWNDLCKKIPPLLSRPL